MLLALGIGSLFNHNDMPNVDYRVDSAKEIITYTSCTDIQSGEELNIYYGSKLWFNDVNKEADEIDGNSSEDSSEETFFNSFNVT
mmetsp:Transcript_31153/g.38483  ORF Transcript_31153/g.38483 Transcript_31153/m.38483 type:complete len:85 (+) Transcript_31153:609-863(+)